VNESRDGRAAGVMNDDAFIPGPLLVVSPHCDDGVLSCGALIAMHPGAIVATVFAGSPARYEPFTEWDRSSGFAPGDDVMALRRDEDRRALEALSAHPVWLPFCDSQYRDTPPVGEIANALGDTLRRHAPRCVAFPLGLFHSDHVLTHDAMMALAPGRERRWLLYVDALYRRIPGFVDERVAKLSHAGHGLHPVHMPVSARAAALKRAAVDCYRSQLRALATPGRLGHLDAYEPEAYLQLAVMEESRHAAA